MSREQNNNDLQRQMAKLISDFPVASILTGTGGIIIASNKRVGEIIGFDPDELTGKPIARIFYSENDASKISAQLETVERGILNNVETSLRDKEGKEQLVSLSVSVFGDNESAFIGRIYCFKRIKRLKRDPALLLKASSIVNQAESLQEGMQRLAEMITLHLSSTFCRILLLDDTGLILVPKAAYHTHRSDGSFKWNDRLGKGTPINKWSRLEKRLAEGDIRVLRIDGSEDARNLQKLAERLELDKPIQSLLSVPLSANGKVVGLLHVGEMRSEERQKFNDEKRALAAAIAAQVTALIESLRLKEISKLAKFAQLLMSSADMNDVHKQIIAGAKELLDADSTVLWSYDKLQDKLTLEPLHNSIIPDDFFGEDTKITPGKQGTASAVMQRGWVGVSDVDDAHHHNFIGPRTRKILSAIDAQSFQGIALKVGDEKLGVLFVNYHHTRTFDEDIKKTALAFADHVALALKTVRLLGQVDKVQATIEMAQKASEATARTIRTMVQGDHKQTLDIIAEGTRDVLHCDAVVLFTYEQASDTLDHPPTMVNVYYPKKAMASEKKLSDSIVKKMLDGDEPYMAEDVSKDPNFKGHRFAIDEGIKSCIAVPLKVGEKRVGVMFVNYRTSHSFTTEDQTNVELFANHAAVAIHNAQLFEEQSKRLNEQKLLADFSGAVLSSAGSENIEDILTHAVAEAAKALGTEFCNIVLPDENGELFFNAAYGWPSSLVGTLKLKKGEGSQTGFTIEAEGPVITYDYSDEKRFTVHKLVIDHHIKSGISVPMFRDGKIVGAMLVHTTRLRQFTEADVRLLSLIANQIAMLLSIVQQYEQIQQHNANLLALHHANKALTSLMVGLELRQVLDLILGQATECIKRKRGRNVVLGTIQLYNEETQELVFESIYPPEYTANFARVGGRWSIPERQAEGKRIGVTGRALLKKEPQLVARVTEDEDYLEYNPTTRSELALPLMIDADGEMIGVLDLESEQEGGFDEGDKELLTLLAEMAVIAIGSARQIKELQQTQAASVAKDALIWMGMSSGYGRHTIQGHAIKICDQVDSINQMPTTKLINGLKSSLDEISLFARMIIEYPISEELSSEELGDPEYVNAMLRKRVRQLQDYSPEKYSPVSIKFDMRLDDEAQVMANSNWLIKALDVLFDNAIGAMKDSESKSLLVATRREERLAVIEITDSGHGIPEEIRSKILNEQIKHEKGSKRLGMGLLMAQFIVKIYKGNIRMVSSGSSGTTMAVYLPLADIK